ncbi:hypothetical protein OG384_04645 [Streptomyces sp. NBC_01324]|uniref:hypothetical protein n=1 Tax=Streptomyces sp. NBC_01324 TaxID=2903826 RepID=UPI002E13FC1E|nr:hypothetical protein OG384_04645 [Streptomyces sp. NBC_01324]
MDTTTPDQALETTPGLVVFRLAPDHKPHNPQRWRIGHKPSGLAIADSMQRENALKGAALLAKLTDWTQDADAVKAAVDREDMFAQLSYVWCTEPGSQPLGAGMDASRNGTYTDADVETAAAAAKASGYNALEVLVAMSETVPWCGLDTEDFNEAHNRIAELADAN